LGGQETYFREIERGVEIEIEIEIEKEKEKEQGNSSLCPTI